ncbi:hypothetical protein PGTUg99_034390 [Puccinia graminis f. sp. tritici]|uniref:Uncharacterized protein n=1 Tax=Puccinia graminis f. sp. tritici TaxID=56615 RepID=A0A5B0RW60_PUCGR|nr:hypothetical protein PGTUg99_034390 [Puccinia graminis f. sp. tritici]
MDRVRPIKDREITKLIDARFQVGTARLSRVQLVSGGEPHEAWALVAINQHMFKFRKRNVLESTGAYGGHLRGQGVCTHTQSPLAIRIHHSGFWASWNILINLTCALQKHEYQCGTHQIQSVKKQELNTPEHNNASRVRATNCHEGAAPQGLEGGTD